VVRIPVEQWCIAVPKREAEGKRQGLIRQGLLDRTLRPKPRGGLLLLPVLEACEGAERCEFEPFPHRPALPRHELIGGIAVLQEEDYEGAERLLASRPSLHTVLLSSGSVEGEFRTRRFQVLAGSPTTRTRVREYGFIFEIDLGLAYFSARLATERQRILEQMEEGETVLDMFAGVGPFAITLARKARIVVAADINPEAVRLLIANIGINRAGNVLPILADAAHLDGIGLRPFDRIVMNLPLAATAFLETAFRLCRSGGHIHLYVLQEREGEILPVLERLPCKKVTERMVRTYSPGRWHAAYDIWVGEQDQAGTNLVP